MEEVKGQLEVFSAILLQQYIRLQTAAVCQCAEKICQEAKFKIAPDVYEKMVAEPLQTALLGLQLNYDTITQILTVVPDDEFLAEFTNNIMRDVALQYVDAYKNRYEKYITFVGNA